MKVSQLHDDLAELIANGYGDSEVRVAAHIMRDVPAAAKYPAVTYPPITLVLDDQVTMRLNSNVCILTAEMPVQREAQTPS